MYRIAVTEDDPKYRAELQQFFERYTKEKGIDIKVDYYENGLDIAEMAGQRYQVILLDIEMPHMNGMESAARIRAADENVQIMFVTHTAQYAVQGYEVGAVDYVLKPVQYYALAMKMDRVLQRCRVRESTKLLISNAEGQFHINTENLCYIEVCNHELCFHLTDRKLTATGTLKEMEKQLNQQAFVRCNNCYLINLKYVDSIQMDCVGVQGERLKMSRGRRKELLQAMMQYCGGSV